jgi:hypothetical protein
MKTKIETIIKRIQSAVEDLQALSFYEFQRLLPTYINNGRTPGYSMLDQIFSGETGINIKDYFNQVKAEKANELFNHYRLSALEVAYQLGFKSTTSLIKATRIRNRYIQSRIHNPHLQRRMINVSEIMR